MPLIEDDVDGTSPTARPVKIEDDTPASRLGEMYRARQSVNPDQFVATEKLANKAKVPFEVANNSPAEVAVQANEPDWESHSKKAPVATRKLSESERLFDLAKDDMDTLSGLEILVNSAKRGVKALAGKAYGAEQGALAFDAKALDRVDELYAAGHSTEAVKARMAGRFIRDAGFADEYMLIADPEARRAKRVEIERQQSYRRDVVAGGIAQLQKERQALPGAAVSQRVAQEDTFLGALGEAASDPLRFIADVGVESLVSMVPSLVAAPATAGTSVLADAALSDYSATVVEELGKAGVDVTDRASVKAALDNPELVAQISAAAGKRALVVGAVERASLGLAGMRLLPKSVQEKLSPFKREAANLGVQIPLQAGVAGAGELVAQDAGGQEYDPGAIVGEMFGEFFGAPAEVLAATVMVKQQADAATETKNQLEQAFRLAEASRLRERDPKSFAEVLQAMADEAGEGSVSSVYVDGADLAEIMAQTGVSFEALAEAMPSFTDNVAAAIGNGIIELPVGELAAYVSGTPLEEKLLTVLRRTPDGMSVAEADVYYQTETAQMQKTAQTILEDKKTDNAFRESAERVRKIVAAEVEAAGYTKEYADIGALLHRDWYTVQAKRMGKTPEEVYAMLPNKITGSNEDPVLANEFDQQSGGFEIPLRVTAEGDDEANISYRGKQLTTAEIVEIAKASGKYDGVIVVKDGVETNVPLTEPENDNGDDEAGAGSDQTQTGELPDGGGVRGGSELLDGQDWPDLGDDQPLAGLPSKFNVSGVGSVDFGPSPALRAAAKAYAEKAGIHYQPPVAYAKVDPARAARIAEAFEQMPHAPEDPAVQAAYNALVKETMAQWEAIKATGLKVEFIDGADPYAETPRLVILDIQRNNHMWVFPTDAGFGGTESADVDITGNPLMALTDEIISGRRARMNDIFRIVHDVFGHAMEGVGFRAEGEENAWQHHAAMFSPLARKAITVETRGQNSWVNFGPYGQKNRTASGADTQYAPQKTGVLPDWVSEEGFIGGPLSGLPLGVEKRSPTDYAVAGDTVSGLSVGGSVPNRGSIASTLGDYEILPGIREIPMSEFNTAAPYSPSERARVETLAEEIKASGRIDPLIVVVDTDGPYILEGSHRFDALVKLGVKSFPALVVRSNEEFQQTAVKTDTPEFRNWFGDSKVVDAEGKPLVVYHGSPQAGFEEFSSGPVFFSNRFDIAASHAGRFNEVEFAPEGAEFYDEQQAVYSSYLSIENPLIVDWGEKDWGDGPEGLKLDDWANRAKRLGHDGLIVRDVVDTGWRAAGVVADKGVGDVFVTFRPEQIKSVDNRGTFDPNDPNILNQKQNSGKTIRGAFNPTTFATRIYKSKDLSTFLHESGHFFLEATFKFAQMPDAPKETVRDAEVLLKWFGVKSVDDWFKMSAKDKRPHHEQFALSFERYLFTGKSPSLELNAAFQRFRDWLTSVYKSMSAFLLRYPAAGKLNPEIRSVMDRMLATDEQITEAERAREMLPMFDSAETSGMTPESWRQYQDTTTKGHDDAVSEMSHRRMRDMQWMRGAHSRVMKKLQKATEEKRKAMRAEVVEELRKEPVYAAEHFLRYGKLVLPNMTNAQRKVAEEASLTGTKLSLPVMKEKYGESEAAIWRYLPVGRNGMAATQGLDPDDVATLFGFTSGDHMIRELLAAEKFSEAVDALTDSRLLTTYGDIITEQGLARAADEAIHNEAYARMIATESVALSRAMGPKMVVDAHTGKKVNVLNKATKDFALRALSRIKVRDIKPLKYTAAEARAGAAAKEAFQKGDIPAAATHKRNQVLQNRMARESYTVLEEIDKAVTYLKKFNREGTRKNIDIDYLDQIDGILERFDLRVASNTNAQLDRRDSLEKWIAKQEELGLVPELPPEITNERNRRPYKELTLEEFRGMVDSIRQIEHLGRLKTKLLTSKDKRDFAEIKARILTSLIENGEGKSADNIARNTAMSRISQGWRGFLSWHRKFSSLMREMDGGKDGGVMWEYLSRSMNAAGDWEAGRREQATMRLFEIARPILEGPRMGGKGVYIKAIGRSLNREERIAVLLNLGNDGNRQRLKDGEGWSDAQLQAIIDTATREELMFAQNVWDFFESFRPEIAAKERRVMGKEPEWVPATPFTVILPGDKPMQLRGGYYPIKYDPRRSGRAEQFEEAETAKAMLRSSYTSATTRRSFTKSRADEVTGRPLVLSLQGLYQGTNEVIHDLAWHEWLIDANRILRDTEVDSAIRGMYGAETVKALRDAVKDIAAGDTPAANTAEQVLNHARTGATIAGLGWNLVTSLLQPLGLSQSAVRIGPGWIAVGMGRFLASPMGAASFVHGKSEFMRLQRAKTMMREISEIQNQVSGGKSKVRTIVDASFFMLIQKMQLVADIPTWIGAYEKALAGAETEERAVALADQAVLDAQGGGQIKDLAAAQRGHPAMKLFTNFYSYFNVTLNLGVERTRATNFRSASEVARLMVDYLLLYSVPVVFGVMMKEALTGEDDDDVFFDERLAKKIANEQISYMLGLLVFARELAAGAQAALGTSDFDRAYSGPAGLRLLSEATKFGQQVGQGEADEALRRAAVNSAGIWLHLPSGQINRTMDGITAMLEGETENPGVLVVGPAR